LIVIKKYENRRLYDTSESRYVNLDEVAQMVREGKEVQVLDAKSNEDLTRLVLTQIIVEGAKDKNSALPTDLLRQMIMASGRAQQQILTSYFRFALDLYLRAHQDLRGRLSPARTAAVGPLEALQKFVGAASSGALPWASARPSADDGPTGQDSVDSAAELQELRARLEALEEQLAHPKSDA
jgi:polyhydroxyalkanoate synthesis repressor PhaR